MINKITHALRVAHSVVREHVVKANLRSPLWPKVRKEFLKENSSCAACGSTTSLQVHHKKPFSLDPTLELEPKNFITLCMGKNECHLLIGHGNNYKLYNPNVYIDALYVNAHPDEMEKIRQMAKAQRKSE